MTGLVALLLGLGPQLLGQGGLQVASVANNGHLGDSSSHSSIISADGRVVAFMSNAENLTPHDGNGLPDVFVRDLIAQTLVCVSLTPEGFTGDSGSYSPSLSTDGRFVAFESDSANLVPGDNNGFSDIFVRDLVTGSIERASLNTLGREADLPCSEPSISGDGRFVVFESYSTSLAPVSNPGVREVFVRDRVAGQTFIASVNPSGQSSNGSSGDASISLDGSRVAFHSWANNLTVDDFNNTLDVFVFDLASREVVLASRTHEGLGGDGPSLRPSLSRDGRLVAFHSDAHNMIPGDVNNYSDCFVRDLENGTTERVSISSLAAAGNEDSDRAVITANGRLVAFHSHASNLVHADSNFQQDIFVHDRISGETIRVSTSPEGVEGNFLSSEPWIAGLTGAVVFESWAENFIPDDQNQVADVFVRSLSGLFTPPNR
jgi:Tol biopolymer transport system component